MSTTEAAGPTSEASSAAPTSPDDRATTFQAVKGEPEHYNGETLLVTAYAALWVIVLVWVASVWRKQASLGTRLDELERVLGEAARKQSK